VLAALASGCLLRSAGENQEDAGTSDDGRPDADRRVPDDADTHRDDLRADDAPADEPGTEDSPRDELGAGDTDAPLDELEAGDAPLDEPGAEDGPGDEPETAEDDGAGPPDDGAADAPDEGGTCVVRPPDVVYAPQVAGIVQDGSLSEWTSEVFVPIDGWDGPAPRPGESDLSGSLAFVWTPAALYAAVDVRDDVHHNDTGSTADLWQGDSVQIAFDVGRNATESGYDSTDDFEYGWALVGAEVRRFRWVQPDGAAPPADSAAVVRDGDRTRYEIALAPGDLGLAAFAPGDVVRMGLIVNEDDGDARDGWLEWGGGIGDYKDPRLFRDLELVSSPICP
jgi:hypothetical protein